VKKLALVALTLCALLGGAAQGQDKSAEQKRADAAAQQNARGAALLKDGKFEEAATELQKAAEAAPKSAVIQSNLGYAYDRQPTSIASRGSTTTPLASSRTWFSVIPPTPRRRRASRAC